MRPGGRAHCTAARNCSNKGCQIFNVSRPWMSAIAQQVEDLFETSRKRLGGTARMGVFGVLFSPKGERRSNVGFNERLKFPMASVVKVPLAMLVASEIANGSLSPHEQIAICSRTASPGLLTIMVSSGTTCRKVFIQKSDTGSPASLEISDE